MLSQEIFRVAKGDPQPRRESLDLGISPVLATGDSDLLQLSLLGVGCALQVLALPCPLPAKPMVPAMVLDMLSEGLAAWAQSREGSRVGG